MTTPVGAALRQIRACCHARVPGTYSHHPAGGEHGAAYPHAWLMPQQSPATELPGEGREPADRARVLDHPQQGDDAGPAARHSGPRDE